MNPRQSNEEIIQKIQEYHSEYDPSSNLTPLEQLEICETLATPGTLYPTFTNSITNETNDNVLKWNDNDSYKRTVGIELTEDKKIVIEELKKCNYLTSRYKIAELLGKLFPSEQTKEGHWLYVAQTWNPRAINRVIQRIIKLQHTGIKTIQDPAAYFTHLLKYRKKRRSVKEF